jgi:hypothetical protein
VPVGLSELLIELDELPMHMDYNSMAVGTQAVEVAADTLYQI